MVTKKPTISLIWIGHVDHGKSTTLGHLLSQIGAVDQRSIEKLREEAIQHQMESWQWAYVLDSLPEEKQRGITSDIAFFPFSTTERNFMLIDAPGHRDFVKNMIRGAAQADTCVLVVSAVPNDLKSGLKVGEYQDPGGQTREHTVLASVLGIKQLIVAINKMDLVDYRKDRYEQAVKEIKDLVKEIQSPWVKNLDEIPFIPISGLKGENLIKPSEKMNWYSGPSLIEALNSLKGIEPDDSSTMRFITYDLDERHGFGTLLLGKVIGASLNVGDPIKILPSNMESEVKEIWMQEEKRTNLDIGEHGSVLLRNIDKDDLEEGMVLSPRDLEYNVSPKYIRARLLILERSFIPGTSMILHCGAAYTTAQVAQIAKILRINPKHKNIPREFDGKITIAFKNELIEVDLALETPLVVERFSDFPELGRVILRHSGQTVAVGVVNDLL